ncbi:hypothetical protein DM860_008013 [Cuscuta australis]|uniref:Uncharacterized protein n=1 Tax=Cuscuta australis TaxID=267555 RepID=A0A328E135_9ASTE|nr:hypothetical protein DM860_008013 [Cuscuta australis]
MIKALRCCISCILPCGALDVIRIVHADGRVEEISGGGVKAAEIMRMHPTHVLKKPSSPSPDHYFNGGAADARRPKIVVVPPDALLRRGKIYFLIPAPAKQRRGRTGSPSCRASAKNGSFSSPGNFQYFGDEIMSPEKVPAAPRDGRRGRESVWRPNLQRICEIPSEAHYVPGTTQE